MACKTKGIEFAAVHDCFWTHAEDMDDLRAILAEEFINLHEPYRLAMLYEEMKARYRTASRDLRSPPERGELDLQQLRKSEYAWD